MTGRWLGIDSRRTKRRYTSMLGFTVGDSEAVDSSVVPENPNLSLYCLDDAFRKAIFVELPPDLDLTSVPDVKTTQVEEAQRLLEIPYESFVGLAAELPEIEHLIMLHNTSRSGSTLLSKVFSKVESVYSLSEPGAAGIFTHLWEAGSDREAELKTLLDSSMRFLFRPAASSGARVFAVKPQNVEFSLMGLYQALLSGGEEPVLVPECSRLHRVLHAACQAPWGTRPLA